MLLGGVFRARKVAQNLAATLNAAKARHNFRDMQRFATLWGVPLNMPKGHPLRTVTALRALLATGTPDMPLIHAFYRAYWVEGRDISAENVVSSILGENGYDPDAILEKANSPAIKESLFTRTSEAIDAGVFGAPSFLVGDTLYFGQDRMDAVEAALGGAPVSPTPWDEAMAPPRPADLYFDYSSPFAAVGVSQARRLFGPSLRLRPMLLGAVFRAVGTENVPLASFHPVKRAFVQRDLARQAEAAGLRLRWPTRFPMRTVLPLRATLAAGVDATPGGQRFIGLIFRAYWEKDQDISSEAVVHALAKEAGLDADAIMQAATSQPIKDALKDATAAAVTAGVFGAPTTVIHLDDGGQELIWGADRMPIALRLARGEIAFG